jgi:hypothetical protein
MSRPKLEVADIFRRHGAAWRTANKAHLSLRGGSFDDLVGAAGECKRQGDAEGFCDDLHAQSCLEIPLGFARHADADGALRAILDLGSARPTLPRASSVSCRLLNQ